jgi:hypothetical protein
MRINLTNLAIQLQDMEKVKVMRKNIWCNTSWFEGNCRDECYVIESNVAMGVPSPFPNGSHR